MKILWVTNSVYPYRESVLEYIRSAHSLDLVTLGAEKSPGGVVHSSWIGKFKYRFRIPFRTLRHLRSKEYIVVGGWDSIGYIFIIFLAIFYRIPHSMLFESTLDSRNHQRGFVSSIRNLVFRKVSTIVTLSELSYQATLHYCGEKDKIIKSKNWFDPLNFPFLEDDGLKVGYRYIYLGRLIPQKGIERMVKAFYEIANPEDSLYVVGEGPEKERVEKICLDGRVVFLGSVEHERLSYFLNKSQALIFPTYNDVYGFPCLEALSCGLGVVVSQQAGIWKDIEDLPGVITFDRDLSSALVQIREVKATRQFIDISDFHFTKVLETLNTAFEKSKKFIAS